MDMVQSDEDDDAKKQPEIRSFDANRPAYRVTPEPEEDDNAPYVPTISPTQVRILLLLFFGTLRS